MSNSQDDVASVIASLNANGGTSGANPPPSAPDPLPDPPAASPATGDAPDAPDPTPRPSPRRGPDGRFVAADDGAPQPPAAPDPSASPEPASNTKEPAAPPKSDSSDPAPIRLDPAKPPQGWRPEIREKWSTIPEDIRREIIRREEASAAGVAKLRQQYEPAENLYRAVSQYEQYFQHIGREPVQYLTDVINMEQSLTLGNPAQKFETILSIADQYGIPIRQALDAAMGGRLNQFIQDAHQQHRTPPAIPPEIQRELQESREFRRRIVEDAAMAEYNAFVADTENHPFFEEVKEDMARLLETGAAETYKEAYELAVYRNPEIRQREIARQNSLAQQEAMRKRQAASSAVAPPGSSPPLIDSPIDPSAAASTEDSIRAVIQKLSR